MVCSHTQLSWPDILQVGLKLVQDNEELIMGISWKIHFARMQINFLSGLPDPRKSFSCRYNYLKIKFQETIKEKHVCGTLPTFSYMCGYPWGTHEYIDRWTHVYVWTHVCEYMCMYVCEGQRTILAILSLMPFTLFTETGPLISLKLTDYI